VLGADELRHQPVNKLGYIHGRFVVSWCYWSLIALCTGRFPMLNANTLL